MGLASWRTARALLTLLGVGAVAISFVDCGGTAKPLGGTPEWLAEPLHGTAPVAPPAAVDAVPAMIADPDAPIFDPARVSPVLDDPRLADVKALVAREAYKGAANALRKRLAEQPPDAALEPAWWYQLGRLYEQAGLPVDAVGGYDRAAASDWVLADYARFLAGDLLTQMDQPGEALARLRAVARGSAIDDEVALATARALAKRREVDAAAEIWRAYLARTPRPAGWQLIALEYAKALLNQPSVAHAEEAVRVARLVILQSPRGRGVGEARALEDQALSTIPSARRARFDKPELAERAKAAHQLAESDQGREAIAAADAVIADLGASDVAGQIACDAYLARGRGLAVVKRYAESSDALGVAIDRCEGLDDQVIALFVGARSALRGGHLAKARERYAKIEKLFPTHRFADDARLHGAEVARELGDQRAFTEMLQTIADAYPEGDMVDQALFTLARDRIEQNDWAGAMTPLQKAVETKKRGRPYYAEGRPQYFLARANIALGAKQEGLAALEEVITGFPLSYYMVLAYARLHRHDADRARRVVHEAMRREPEGDFVIPDHAELHRPGFLRAVALVEQGDSERSLAELEQLGVLGEGADPSLLWASAFLLARIDAPAESHNLLRRSSNAWMAHYPAGVWRQVWELAYPRPFQEQVARELQRSPIPEHLAYAIMREESAFKPRAVSHAGAIGLMQLIVPTARSVAKGMGIAASETTLKRPEVNIALGTRFLHSLQARFDYNPLLAIPGYNAGPGAPARWVDERPAADFDLWVERIPYTETRRYTKRVIQSMAAYSMLYGRGMADRLMLLPLTVKPPE